MKRSERRKRGAARAAERAEAHAGTIASTAARASRWRSVAWAGASLAALALGGYFGTATYAARSAKPAAPRVIEGNGVDGPRGMVWVPGGEFLMGSDHKLAQKNERPAHKVRVKGFWMDRTHVTNAQFADFVRATGHVTTAQRKPDWETLKVQLAPGTPRPPDSALVPGAMVFIGTERPVGLADMTGNAWQWVADWYGAAYFAGQAKGGKPIVDPQGPPSSHDPDDRGVPSEAPKRVTRGGSFLCNVDYCLSYRPSARRGTDPYNPMSHIGFRLAISESEWQARKAP